MALNPFFLNNTFGEQGLLQDLINEQIKMFGIEIVYIPRKFVRKETILKEVSSSKFNEAFSIEAYLDNYDGYVGQGDVLTKFGVSLKDDVSLIISRERFENFIYPFLRNNTDETELSSRPKEGDLVYFPLGKRLFEVKFVEHEVPFYQLGKLYVYQLKCELFEYEDEVLDTSIREVDTKIQEEGYIATINVISLGSTATANTSVGTGYIRKIYLNNDGYSYTSAPNIIISPAPSGGVNATAVAITTESTDGVTRSIKDILLTHAGIGYTQPPTITISGGGGIGAAATCSIEKIQNGVVSFSMVNLGSGYSTKPTITISSPTGTGQTAIGIASLNGDGEVSSILISNPGVGYTQSPTVTVAPPSIISGLGTYVFNEIITGTISGTKARVKSWDSTTNVLKVSLININDSTFGFYRGETIVGSISSAIYAVDNFDLWDHYDKYSDNVTIQTESEKIVDVSESNPFGYY